MKDSLESKLGMFFVLAVLAVMVILQCLGGFSFFQKGYHVAALFKSVQELKKGDPVKMAGVPVGRVESIKLTNGTVEVSMNLNKDADVRTESKATIRFTGLMGQNYVAIDFGHGVKAENGVFLDTVEQADLSTLMARIDNVASGVENLTKSFSGEKIDNLLGPFTDFLKNNKDHLTAMIGNMKTVSDRIVEGKGTVGKLINEDTLYTSALNTVSNLQNSVTNIQQISADAHDLLTNANSIVSQVNAGHGTAGKLVKDETLYNEATGMMTNMHSIMHKIDSGEGSIGKLVNDDSTLRNLKLSMQKLDKATESLEDTGPLSVMGTMVNSLF